MTRMRIKKFFSNLAKLGLQILLSLLPLILYLLVHWMFQLKEDPVRRYISELCSFTLVMSSSVAMELFRIKHIPYQVRAIIFSAYFALLAVFFSLYGIINYCMDLGLQLSPVVLNNMFLTIMIICGIDFVIALLLQILEVFYGE